MGMGIKVFAAFGSVALQPRAQKVALLCKNGHNISEEENTQLTIHTAEADFPQTWHYFHQSCL
jgi:hypothetical protein